MTWTQGDNGFVYLAGGDTHLLASATEAIDQGSDLEGPVSSQDFDGNDRPAGELDIGIDELHPEVVARRENVELYRATGFFYLGAGRGSVSSSDELGYIVGALAGTPTVADTLYVVRFDSTSVQTVASIQAAGPILDVAYVVDDTTVGASWRAWVFLVVDTDADGYGDSIQMVIDEGDGGLSHPTGSLTDSDPTNRRFGDVSVGGAFVYRPGASPTDYRIARLILDTLIGDGDVDPADPEYDSPSGTNRAKWLRLFFSAFKTTATEGGALFKVNADPYDSTDGPASNNDAFGSTMWEIGAGTHEHDYQGVMTWTTSTKKLFVPVSNSVISSQTVLVRYAMVGLSAPLSEVAWRAREEAASVDENRFGATLDGGGSSARVTYAVSDGTVVYNRDIGSADGAAGLRWASRLPATPSIQPVRFSPYPFTLVGVEGAVHKIWSSDSDADTKNGVLAATGLKVVPDDDQVVDESPESGAQDLDWPLETLGAPLGRIWPRGTSLFWATDKNAVYDWSWDRTGDALGTAGDETITPGSPYIIPGAAVTWAFVSPAGKVLVGTDGGSIYTFDIDPEASASASPTPTSTATATPTPIPSATSLGLVALALLLTGTAWSRRRKRA